MTDDIQENVQNLYRVTPRQLAVKLEKAFYAGNVPFVKGSPGVGKSSIYAQVAKKLNLKLIDHRLSTSAPEDLTGLPEFYDTPYGRRSRFVPFDLFPLEGQPIEDGFAGWLVFLDEINSASKMVQAASYKLLLDRQVNQTNLHQFVKVGTAGNLSTDRAITNEMSTALKSRMSTFHLVHSHDEWMADVAIPREFDARILAFLARYPSKLMDFRPDMQDDSFCSPRTWEFMNNFVRNEPEGPISKSEISTYTGTITSGVAAEFVTFTEVFANLIDVRDILADPMNCIIPRDPSAQWANIAAMLEKVDETNFEKLAQYAGRFSLDFRILFFRAVLVKDDSFREQPAFMKATIDLMKYLNPEASEDVIKVR